MVFEATCSHFDEFGRYRSQIVGTVANYQGDDQPCINVLELGLLGDDPQLASMAISGFEYLEIEASLSNEALEALVRWNEDPAYLLARFRLSDMRTFEHLRKAILLIHPCGPDTISLYRKALTSLSYSMTARYRQALDQANTLPPLADKLQSGINAYIDEYKQHRKSFDFAQF